MRTTHAPRARRLGVVLGSILLTTTTLVAATSAPTAAAGRRLPGRLGLDPGVKQVVTVTSTTGWGATRASLVAWRKRSDGWHQVHGPVTVRLGWNGWKAARKRLQNSGTTPAGIFGIPMAFGNRADPGTRLPYRQADGNDMWPYEPRDPATYNIYQPFQSGTSHWRTDYRERLADYPTQYAYAAVIGFNLPGGVHWSTQRHQWVARRQADTTRGGGIFLHEQLTRYTAGCVAGPSADVQWVLRWLRPGLHPRIAMGPRAWLVRRF